MQGLLQGEERTPRRRRAKLGPCRCRPRSCAKGITNMVRISDRRMSGTAYGAAGRKAWRNSHLVLTGLLSIHLQGAVPVAGSRRQPLEPTSPVHVPLRRGRKLGCIFLARKSPPAPMPSQWRTSPCHQESFSMPRADRREAWRYYQRQCPCREGSQHRPRDAEGRVLQYPGYNELPCLTPDAAACLNNLAMLYDDRGNTRRPRSSMSERLELSKRPRPGPPRRCR
jgi:hypothetical protein